MFVPVTQALTPAAAPVWGPCRKCGATVEQCNTRHVREGCRCCYGECDHRTEG